MNREELSLLRATFEALLPPCICGGDGQAYIPNIHQNGYSIVCTKCTRIVEDPHSMSVCRFRWKDGLTDGQFTTRPQQ